MKIKSILVKNLTKIKNININKLLKKGEGFKFNKENLYSWMNLTKKERFNLSKKDSMNYLIDS